MKTCKNILEGVKIKSSYQRMKILEHLQRSRRHPTVDMIYRALIKEIPTISKTTVYNTLRAFVEKGLVADLTISGGESRYDYIFSPHSHFLCKKCGNVLDIESHKLPCKVDKIEGNKVDEAHVYFKGICKKCLKRG